MTLEKIRAEGHGVTKTRLVACPFCGHDFEKNEPRWLHILEEHDPEDGGLSPAGEIGENRGPLFEPPTERFVSASTHYDAREGHLTPFGREFLGLESRNPPEADGGQAKKEI